MNAQEKLRLFIKGLLQNVTAQTLPGSTQLRLNIAQRLYEIFSSAQPEDRETLCEAAREMSVEGQGALIQEVAPGLEAQAVQGMLEVLRSKPKPQQMLESINLNMLKGTGLHLQAQKRSPQQRLVGAAVISKMMAPATSGGRRAPHPSRWPLVPGHKLTAFLGQGDFAEVYLAHQLDEEGAALRTCALKVGDLYDPQYFDQKMKAIQRVSHPNLISCLGGGVLEEPPPAQFWISMPNLSGLTLRDLMLRGLETEQKLLLAVQILEGLQALHQEELSHQDLRPENVLLGDDFEIKLTGFGLGKSEEALKGSLYMSPEQLKSPRGGAETDIWAFGLLLYELFAGRSLFADSSDDDLYTQIGMLELELGEIPETLRPVLERSLQHDLGHRYQNAMALAQEFIPPAEALRRKLRYERYRGCWKQVLEEGLLEKFAARHRGVLPEFAAECFISNHPELPELDMERLEELLPEVFAAQVEVEQIEAKLAGLPKVDWEEKLRRAEAQVGKTLGIESVDEAIARAAEVDQAKHRARTALEEDRARTERESSSLRELLSASKDQLKEVVRGVLQDELCLSTREESTQTVLERVTEKLEAEQKSFAQKQKQKGRENQAVNRQKMLLWMVIIFILSIMTWWVWIKYEENETKYVDATIEQQRIQWVEIEGGDFKMGSEEGADNERPVHPVSLSNFLISKSEVTVAQYRACVEAGECSQPGGAWDECNWRHLERGEHPINCVNWDQAVIFAEWAGGRLPTEAEWEFAARSRGQEQNYSWGDQEPNCLYAVMDEGGDGCGKDGTWPVCSKPKGTTKQGLCDMAGNVWEWVQDRYQDDYSSAPLDGSAYVKSGRNRSRRGGSWNSPVPFLRATLRNGRGPGYIYYSLGFRIAKSPSPP